MPRREAPVSRPRPGAAGRAQRIWRIPDHEPSRVPFRTPSQPLRLHCYYPWFRPGGLACIGGGGGVTFLLCIDLLLCSRHSHSHSLTPERGRRQTRDDHRKSNLEQSDRIVMMSVCSLFWRASRVDGRLLMPLWNGLTFGVRQTHLSRHHPAGKHRVHATLAWQAESGALPDVVTFRSLKSTVAHCAPIRVCSKFAYL